MFVLHDDEEPDTDPLGMSSDAEARVIYSKLSELEQKVYRELIQCYRKQMHLHDTMVPTYKEVHSTVNEHFPLIPSKDGDCLADAQRQLLAGECMKALCKDLGYAMPKRLRTEWSTAEDNLPRPTLWFKLIGPES